VIPLFSTPSFLHRSWCIIVKSYKRSGSRRSAYWPRSRLQNLFPFELWVSIYRDTVCVRPSALRELRRSWPFLSCVFIGCIFFANVRKIVESHKYAQASTRRARTDVSLTESVLLKDSRLTFSLSLSLSPPSFFLVSWVLGVGSDGVHLERRPLDWPIVPAADDRWWWMWSSRWNDNWQWKPKYSEKTCPSATLSTTNPTWLDWARTRRLNPLRYFTALRWVSLVISGGAFIRVRYANFLAQYLRLLCDSVLRLLCDDQQVTSELCVNQLCGFVVAIRSPVYITGSLWRRRMLVENEANVHCGRSPITSY
jgi:hypothetical protein